MPRAVFLAVVLCFSAALCAQQDVPDAPKPQNNAPPPAAQQPPPPAAPSDQQSDDSDQKKPEAGIKHPLKHLSSICLHVGNSGCVVDHEPKDKDKSQQQAQQPPRSDVPPNNPMPRSDTTPPDESSSNATHLDSGPPPDDVKEFTPFDPHKAAKDVEVGDFYFKRKNYRAAASRYREALYWKSNDAIATFRLAQTLEAMGDLASAVKRYQSYLQILPDGPDAAEAKKAIERLQPRLQSLPAESKTTSPRE